MSTRAPSISGRLPAQSELKAEGSEEVKCNESSAVGEITGAVAGTVTETFTGCELVGKKCESSGNQEGTISTNLLAFEIGYVKARGEVGQDFRPAKGEVLYEYGCSTEVVVRTKGSVIARLETPVNAMSVQAELAYRESGGKQEIKNFEEGPKDTLIAEVSLGGGPFSSIAVRELAVERIENSPQVVTKRGKTTLYSDPSEINTRTGARAPEYGRCRKARNGKFKDLNCSELESAIDRDDKFEFAPVPA